MAYYDSRYQRPRHDAYYSSPRDTGAYSRHVPSSPRDDGMRYRLSQPPPEPSPSSRHSYEPRYASPAAQPPPTKRQPSHRLQVRRRKWPPTPSVEDEDVALAKEVVSSPAGSVADDASGEVQARGSVDQQPILEQIAQPPDAPDSRDRRFVLVSDPDIENDLGRPPPSTVGERRRKSFAKRGNMPPLKTDLDEPPVFTERISTPYSYTKPQRESFAAPSSEYLLSPEPITSSPASIPRSATSRDSKNPKSSRPSPLHNRYDSVTQSPPSANNDVFDDSDVEDTMRLRTDRKPARYSFVKSNLQREHLRTDLRDSQSKPESTRADAGCPVSSSRGQYEGASSGSTSSKDSPRSSSSSLNERRKPRPAPLDGSYGYSSRPPTRPSSPSYRERETSPPRSPKPASRRPASAHPSSPSYRGREISPPRSPKLTSRRPASPTVSRPSSRAGTRPPSPSPLSASTSFPVSPSSRLGVAEADWHATYPPVAAQSTSRPPSRYGRHETMPVPTPRIDVQSPSPARPPKDDDVLPYPVDDRPPEVFMPLEEKYQYDHSNAPVSSSPREPLSSPKSPRVSSRRPSFSSRHTAAPEELPRMAREGSSNIRSRSSHDVRRERVQTTLPDPGKPLPSCPRKRASAKYNDWYQLENVADVYICPSCYEGVFNGTPFANYFLQPRQSEARPTERACDFNNPWMRLAWLLTIKQKRQRPSLSLLLDVAEVIVDERPCPEDRDISIDRLEWYGIVDQRDGTHVPKFAVCPCDMRMIKVLFPTVCRDFSQLPMTSYTAISGQKYVCSLRTTSKRFATYVDLLIDLDKQARNRDQPPDMSKFVQVARENAFKDECNRGKQFIRKSWHYIPELPEFTVCEECYDEVVWPAIMSKTEPTTIPRMFNKTLQFVPGEDPEVGSSCCLYSPRMRSIWERAVKEQDFGYLKRKTKDRKEQEREKTLESIDVKRWMDDYSRNSKEFELGRAKLKQIEREWLDYE